MVQSRVAGAQFLPAAPDAAAGARREEIGQQRSVDGMAEAVHDRAQMRRRRGAVLQGREGRGHALHRQRPLQAWWNPASSCRSAPSSANSACCRRRTCGPRRWNASRPASSSASATPRSRSSTCRTRHSASTSFVSPAPGCFENIEKLEQRLAQQTAPAPVAGRAEARISLKAAGMAERPFLRFGICSPISSARTMTMPPFLPRGLARERRVRSSAMAFTC